MIDERENIFDETNLGSLTARSYNISGNDIDAFYDETDNLVFVLDKTINQNKPNVLLVINPVSDKKWDEILSGQYGADLETIRPKQDNKYQKLDIEYSGLGVYKNLIDAFVNGGALDEHLVQLDILRDSAVRHSAMTRLNVANEIITKTNATIVKTKESIVRLQERLKTLRTRLSEQKKAIGRVSTKQSAAKILKLESMIEATTEKLKRAEKRLESAQKRLEIATVDAELATNALNQPNREIKTETKSEIKNQPLAVAPNYPVQKTESDDEDDDSFEEPEENFDIDGDDMEEDKDLSENSEIKPLLDKDPEIINEDIAFKPISFEAPELITTNTDEKDDVPSEAPEILDVPEITDEKDSDSGDVPVVNVEENTVVEPDESEDDIKFDDDFGLEQRPVLESMTPVAEDKINAIEINDDDDKEEEDIVETKEDIVENDDFDAPALSSGESEQVEEVAEVVEEKDTDNHDNNIDEEKTDQIPSVEDKSNDGEKDIEKDNEVRPVENLIRPMPPAGFNTPVSPVKPITASDAQTSKTSFVYYVVLLVLIVLSVLALWLYQKNMGAGKPFFGDEFVEEQEVNTDTQQQEINDWVGDDSNAFFEDEPAQPVEVVVPKTNVQPVNVKPEPKPTPEPVEPSEPVVINSVSDSITSFSGFQPVEEEQQTEKIPAKPEVVVNKPVYDAGSRYDEMFVYEEDQVPVEYIDDSYVEYEPEVVYYEEIVDDDDVIYEPVDENYGEEPVIEQPVDVQPAKAEPERIVYDGDDIYSDYGNAYEEGFDTEEAVYQAGYDGYEIY